MKLLLIEDNPAMQTTLQRSFERRGITVVPCADGARALDRWRASVPDVVLLDLSLPGLDGLQVRGTLWGGNLCLLASLLATPHWPRIRGGVLFVEDVNEHPYRIERSLLQLHQAGVLDGQKAVLLGAFTEYRKSPLDRGYGLRSAVAYLRSLTKTPLLTGLPFGHVPTKVCLPVGAKVTLLVDGRDAFVGW